MSNPDTLPKPDPAEQPSPEGLAAVPLFGFADEMEFRRQFAIHFLASYAAANFNDLCANGRQDSLESLPVEDAEYLSGTAWRHWCYTMPMKPNTDSTAVDAYQMRRTRERLASSPAERQRAIAEFPLRVANIAKDLASMCEVRDSGHVMHKDSEEVMRYMEDRIRQCYREMFGTELGQ